MLASTQPAALRAGRVARAYQTVDAQSRSPLELVVMLYDGAIRFLTQAKDAHGRGDLRARAAGVSRALAIVGELQSTLDVERGQAVAEELDRLYQYITTRLLQVTLNGDVTALEESARLLGHLREAWSEVSGSVSAPPVRA
jgi:flagellar protein FliS